jgi:hypothetical protein
MQGVEFARDVEVLVDVRVVEQTSEWGTNW